MSKVVKLVGVLKGPDRKCQVYSTSPDGSRKYTVATGLSEAEANELVEDELRLLQRKCEHLREVRQELNKIQREANTPITQYQDLVL